MLSLCFRGSFQVFWVFLSQSKDKCFTLTSISKLSVICECVCVIAPWDGLIPCLAYPSSNRITEKSTDPMIPFDPIYPLMILLSTHPHHKYSHSTWSAKQEYTLNWTPVSHAHTHSHTYSHLSQYCIRKLQRTYWKLTHKFHTDTNLRLGSNYGPWSWTVALEYEVLTSSSINV